MLAQTVSSIFCSDWMIERHLLVQSLKLRLLCKRVGKRNRIGTDAAKLFAKEKTAEGGKTFCHMCIIQALYRHLQLGEQRPTLLAKRKTLLSSGTSSERRQSKRIEPE